MAVAKIAGQRIKREIRDMLQDPEAEKCGVSLKILDDNFHSLRGELMGPPNTPYEGGHFQLEIIIPDSYPFSPPKIRFITKIWHPNISSVTGAICVDILKDQWAAAMTLRTTLLSLQALLCCPEENDPQDSIVAMQYRDTHEIFLRTARHWTTVYAGAPKLQEYEKLEQMVKDMQLIMGVQEELSRARLSQANWDYQKAVELCLS